jgi:hypothetical protein
MTTTTAHPATEVSYTRNHDGVLPFAPVRDLDDLRRDVAASCAITMNYGDHATGEHVAELVAEARALSRYHGELLSAAIWRTDAEAQR